MADVIQLDKYRKDKIGVQSFPLEHLADVVSLEEYKIANPKADCGCSVYVYFLAMCVICLSRWTGQAPECTNLFTLECPGCGSQDSFAGILPDNYYPRGGDPNDAA